MVEFPAVLRLCKKCRLAAPFIYPSAEKLKEKIQAWVDEGSKYPDKPVECPLCRTKHTDIYTLAELAEEVEKDRKEMKERFEKLEKVLEKYSTLDEF